MTERRKDLVDFEAQLREMKDPTVQLFLGMIDGMSPTAKDTALERQKKMMSIGEAMTISPMALGRMIRIDSGVIIVFRQRQWS